MPYITDESAGHVGRAQVCDSICYELRLHYSLKRAQRLSLWLVPDCPQAIYVIVARVQTT